MKTLRRTAYNNAAVHLGTRAGAHLSGAELQPYSEDRRSRARCSSATRRRRAWALSGAAVGLLLLGAVGGGWAGMGGGPPSTAHPEGCLLVHGERDFLRDITLVEQHGHKVSLAALKGHLVLINFVDTACVERCAPLTATLAYAADELHDFLGESIFFVSISSDPERDSPGRLLEFARANRCEHLGWLFLTGPSVQVDLVMEPFGLANLGERSGWGSQAAFAYLLDRSGRLRRIYDLNTVRKGSLAFDLFRLLPDGELE